jgi:hypothetical protein
MWNPLASQERHEEELVGIITKQVKEGVTLLQKEEVWNTIPKCYAYIKGKQGQLKSEALSRVVDNRIKRGLYEVTAALTDVRQIWNYKASDVKLKDQEVILNKLAPAWWLNTKGDRALSSTVMDAHIATAYIHVKWNPDLPGGGDIELIPAMTKDIIPIGPTYAESLQDWQGVAVRSTVNAEALRKLYPAKALEIKRAQGQTFYGQDLKEAEGSVQTPNALERFMTGSMPSARNSPGTVEVLTVYYKDGTSNLADMPVLMGEGTMSEYMVQPGKLLYPRGRCTTIIPQTVLADGPNPYWHGMFPVVRVCLEPVSETLLGNSAIGQIISLQDVLNEVLRGYEDATKQWVRRGIVVDSRSAAGANIKAIDTRKAGIQVKLNPNGGGEGFRLLDGPNLPPFFMEMVQYIHEEIDDLLGVKDLKQLMSARTNPSEDAVQRFSESLNPVLRGKARAIEVALSEIGEMMKVNFFQFYTQKRRVQILGKDGLTLDDFDYDPGSLVPQSAEDDQRSRTERAMEHHKNFSFVIAPNSFLEVSHTQRKMFILQLFRENKIDPWTMYDALGITNVGPTPPISIPERIDLAKQMGLMDGPTVEQVKLNQQMQTMQLQQQIIQMQQQAMMAMQQAAAAGLPGGGPPGQGGPPQEGGPQGPPPPGGIEPQKRVGRPPSGQEPPQMLLKDNGTRMVVSESGR